uniref:RING-type E3 ubiquitin transferase n=1 Tax=Eptatretus burgeri TaxID=7764 RepID=A0A8C4NHS4_EPTBU
MYFMHGVCREGRSCPYSHDLSNSKPAMACRFYQRGCCAYADGCRYDHVKASGHAKQQSTSASTKPLSQPIQLPTDNPKLSKPVPLGKKKAAGGDAVSHPPRSGNEPKVKNNVRADWANAEEFVPGIPYSAHVPSLYSTVAQEGLEPTTPPAGASQQLCPYAACGECRYGDHCVYLHGDYCDMCGLQVLHPCDKDQRSEHQRACLAAHEKDMEAAFAVQRSNEVVCGICMEIVYEKPRTAERRFGILSSCSHAYCLSCIRKWRRTKQLESKVIKACPECRVTSDFVIPSEYWFDSKEEKDNLISSYKDAMGKKACRYFDQGKGSCPFGSSCFYMHVYPDGRKEERQPPRKQHSSEGRVRFQSTVRLWDFIEERETRISAPFDSDDDDISLTELSDLLFMLLSGEADFHSDSDEDGDDDEDDDIDSEILEDLEDEALFL